MAGRVWLYVVGACPWAEHQPALSVFCVGMVRAWWRWVGGLVLWLGLLGREDDVLLLISLPAVVSVACLCPQATSSVTRWALKVTKGFWGASLYRGPL